MLYQKVNSLSRTVYECWEVKGKMQGLRVGNSVIDKHKRVLRLIKILCR
jgi:hypothetical protein